MRNLENINGQLLGKMTAPLIKAGKVFEGIMDFKWYRDAVEYGGTCFHCQGVVAGVLRIEDPALQTDGVRSAADQFAIKRTVQNIVQSRHQCSRLHDGKDDVDEFLRKAGK